MYIRAIILGAVFSWSALAHTPAAPAVKSRYAKLLAAPDDIGLYDEGQDWKRALVGKDAIDRVFTMLSMKNPWICEAEIPEYENVHQTGAKAYEALEDKVGYEARYNASAKAAFENAQTIEDFLRAGRKFRFTTYGDKAMARAIELPFHEGTFHLIPTLARGLLFDSKGQFRSPRQDDVLLTQIAMAHAQLGDIPGRDRILAQLAARNFTHLTIADEPVVIQKYILKSTLKEPREFDWKRNVRFIREALTYADDSATNPCANYASYTLRDSRVYYRRNPHVHDVGKLHAAHFSGDLRDLAELLHSPDRFIEAAAIHTLLALPEAPEKIFRLIETGRDVQVGGALKSVDKASVPLLLYIAKNSDNNYLRVSAIDRLGELHAAEAYSTIVSLFGDESERVRLAAYGNVAQLGGPQWAVVSSLFEAAQRHPIDERIISQALGGLPATKIGEVLNYLESPDENLRKLAATSLGRREERGRPAVSALMIAAADPDATVRQAAIEALGEIEGKLKDPAASVRVLSAALEDSSPNVRSEALRALVFLKHRASAAVPSIIRLLERETGSGLQSAVKALGEIGESPEIALPALERLLKNKDICSEAISAMRKFGEPARAYTPQILAALGEDEIVKANGLREVAFLWEGAEPPVALVTMLKEAVSNPRASMRSTGITALTLFPMHGKSIRTQSRQAIASPNIPLRFAASKLLLKYPENADDTRTAVRSMLDMIDKERIPFIRFDMKIFKDASPEIVAYLKKVSSDVKDDLHSAAAAVLFQIKK